jgi:lipopolysaccharide/colanic/teichoic acid biosynthesis glycosyltransferase
MDALAAASTLLARASGANGVAAAVLAQPAVLEPRILPAEAAPRTFYLRHGKRILDVLGAVAGLLVSSPVLVLAALLIKLDSRGPVLYKSIRLGKGGRPFTFYKLRSMQLGADRERDRLRHLNEVDGPVFKLTRDPRTTRVGRWIRQSSIDELPQFVNVLRGDMSLVGPRPPLPEEVEKYESWQRRRLDVKPGLTCLWQISGRSRLGFNEWMRLDLEYIKRQSLRTDVVILWRTLPAVVSREGAY